MLVLSRKVDETVVIAENITVTIVQVSRDKVRLAFDAPKDTIIHRKEVYDAIHAEKSQQLS